MAADPELANVFPTRGGYGGSNVLPVFHRTNRAAGVHLPDGVSNQEVYGTVLEAFYSVEQSRQCD